MTLFRDGTMRLRISRKSQSYDHRESGRTPARLTLRHSVFYLVLAIAFLSQAVFAQVSSDGDLEKDTPIINLTKEEKTFLQENRVIKVHMESVYAPISYIEKDKFVGYSIEYADLIASILGVAFEYKQNVPWSQAIEDLKSRRVDVIAQMINSEARQKYTMFTEGYYTLYQGIVARLNSDEYSTLNQLYGKTVGVVKGYYAEDVIREHHKPINKP